MLLTSLQREALQSFKTQPGLNSIGPSTGIKGNTVQRVFVLLGGDRLNVDPFLRIIRARASLFVNNADLKNLSFLIRIKFLTSSALKIKSVV